MKNLWKYIVGVLCVACCAVPIWLIASAGVFSLSIFTERIELIACAGIIFVVVIVLYLKKKKVHGNTCAIDCECGKGKGDV
jgi:heme/copper-type cytochrome/quinol oxidase subunit 4